jgi:hypothetical protein
VILDIPKLLAAAVLSSQFSYGVSRANPRSWEVKRCVYAPSKTVCFKTI